jgi:hypothetical protein
VEVCSICDTISCPVAWAPDGGVLTVTQALLASADVTNAPEALV